MHSKAMIASFFFEEIGQNMCVPIYLKCAFANKRSCCSCLREGGKKIIRCQVKMGLMDKAAAAMERFVLYT